MLQGLLLTSCLIAFSFISGACSGDEEEAGITADPCAVQTLPLQSRDASHWGRLYLPAMSDVELCGAIAWSMTGAPEGNANLVVAVDDGFARFTPHVEGDYTFSGTHPETGEILQERFTVVSSVGQPFHNYNYYPWHSVANVGDELWIANVYSPTISRLSRVDLSTLGLIEVGEWPTSLAVVPGQDLVLVANKASDTLGFVDVREERQIDAIWVGDAPAGVVVSSDGAKAYVSLSGSNRVAVVDVATRKLVKQIDTVFDPMALALNEAGDELFVASHRSGQTNQYPYVAREMADEKDIAIIDTNALEVKGHILEASSTINDLYFNAESNELWMVGTDNDIEGGLNDPDVYSFMHEVVVLSPEAGEANRLRSADLTRQETSAGDAVSLQNMTLCNGEVWVTAESSDATIVLDPSTLEEKLVTPQLDGHVPLVVMMD